MSPRKNSGATKKVVEERTSTIAVLVTTGTRSKKNSHYGLNISNDRNNFFNILNVFYLQISEFSNRKYAFT